MNSVKTSVRVHIFKFSAETTLEENLIKGGVWEGFHMGLSPSNEPDSLHKRESPINVKNVKTPSVGFQVFKPIRESTVEQN